ncbi:MAG: hypothetical protein J1F18_07300 [Lachnospiraceae bacterium]|nr:hypothetical protein [Lachnospiraceae bacterium]
MKYLISMIVVLLVAWLAIAYLLVIFKKSETYADALTLVLNTFWSWGKFNSPATIYALSDTQVSDLTDKLKPHFDYIVFDAGIYESNHTKVCYQVGGCKIPISVIEKIFENFLRQTFNLNAVTPLFIFGYFENGHLNLMCGWTQEMKEYIQNQRNNRRSREIESARELVE